MEIPLVLPLPVPRPLAPPLPFPRADKPLPEPAPVLALFTIPVSAECPPLGPVAVSVPPLLPLSGCEARVVSFVGPASAERPLPPAGDLPGAVVPREGPTTKLPVSCASGIWRAGSGAALTAFTTMTDFRAVICNSTTELLTALGGGTSAVLGGAGSAAAAETCGGAITSLGKVTVASGMGTSTSARAIGGRRGSSRGRAASRGVTAGGSITMLCNRNGNLSSGGATRSGRRMVCTRFTALG